MKFDILHNFISPVTGRVLADFNYVLVGNRQGIATASPILIDIRLDLINLRKRYNTLVDADFIVGHPNDQIPNAQVLVNLADGFMVNTAGIVSTTATIPIGTLPDLTFTYLWTGNIFNRPIEVQNIILANMADLTFKRIWRGNLIDRPIESDDLTTVETDLSDALSQIANLASLLASLASAVSALQSIVAGLEAGLASVGGWVGIALLQTQVLGLIVAIAATNARIDALRLNNISADADVSLYGFKIINLANPINPQDAATKFYVDSAIGGGAAPINATYIIQTADALLTNAQVLASLTTGLVKNTTTTGVLSIGVPGTDYYSLGHPTTLIDDFNFNGSPTLSYGNLGVGTEAFNSLVLNSILNTYNTAIGLQALYAFTTGIGNTALGQVALFSLVSGSYNTAFGANAGFSLTTGTANTFFGTLVANFVTGGNNNCAFGASAFYNAGSSSNNSVFGYHAAHGQPTYTDCCFFGFGADASVNNLTNAIAIGANAAVSASNSLVLGNGVNVGIGTSTPAYLLDVIGITRASSILIGTGTNHVGFQAGVLSSNILWTLPITDSTGTQALISNGSGTLSWQSLTSGTVTSVSGTAGQIDVATGTTTPVISIDTGYIGQSSITTLGTVTAGTWHGSLIDLAHGGTNANLTASNGGIVYSTASALAVLAGTATANQILLSGTSAAPTWSTVTHPATTIVNQLLYSSATNVISGLATANSAVLLTNGSGVPAWQTLSSSAVTSITGTANQITASGSTGAVTLSLPTSVIITTSVTAGNLELITNTLQSNNANGNILVTPNGTGIISLSSNVGLGTTAANSPLQFSNSTGYRTLTLFEVANNGFQFHGFGVSGGIVYNVAATTSNHTFYCGTSSTTSQELMRITAGGVGIGGTGANAPLQFAAVNANRKIVFIEVANNDNQVTALGAPSTGMRFQVPDTGKLFVYNAGTSATTSQELMRVTATGTTGNSGCIGINVGTTPLAGCHVIGGVQNVSGEDTCFRAESANSNAKIELTCTNGSGRLYEIRSTNSGTLDIVDRTGSAEKIVINTTGVGISSAPSFLLDVFGTTRVQKLLGNAHAPTVSLGGTGQVGVGATSSVVGSEVGGRFTLNTGTGALTTGTLATFTLASAMPSSTFSVIFYPASGAISLNVNSTSSTQFTINNTGLLGLTASTTYVWNYVIIGY